MSERVPTGIYALRDAQGNVAATWLAIDWFVWAVLWFFFFLLLALERPIMRQVGWATIAVAIGTAWIFGYAIPQGGDFLTGDPARARAPRPTRPVASPGSQDGRSLSAHGPATGQGRYEAGRRVTWTRHCPGPRAR
jgi:hypothetical protein